MRPIVAMCTSFLLSYGYLQCSGRRRHHAKKTATCSERASKEGRGNVPSGEGKRRAFVIWCQEKKGKERSPPNSAPVFCAFFACLAPSVSRIMLRQVQPFPSCRVKQCLPPWETVLRAGGSVHVRGWSSVCVCAVFVACVLLTEEEAV